MSNFCRIDMWQLLQIAGLQDAVGLDCTLGTQEEFRVCKITTPKSWHHLRFRAYNKGQFFPFHQKTLSHYVVHYGNDRTWRIIFEFDLNLTASVSLE